MASPCTAKSKSAVARPRIWARTLPPTSHTAPDPNPGTRRCTVSGSPGGVATALSVPEGIADSAGLQDLVGEGDPHEGEIAVVLVEIEPVPEDEAIGDGETAVMDGNDGLAALGLVEQRAHPKRLGAAGREQLEHGGDRPPPVDYVFYH